MTAASKYSSSLKSWSHCPRVNHFIPFLSIFTQIVFTTHPAVSFHSSQSTYSSTVYFLSSVQRFTFALSFCSWPELTVLTDNASLICQGESLRPFLSFPWGISQTSSALLSFISYLSHSSVCHSNLLTLELSILAMTVDSCLLSHLPFGSQCISRSVCPVCLQFTVCPCACVFS